MTLQEKLDAFKADFETNQAPPAAVEASPAAVRLGRTWLGSWGGWIMAGVHAYRRGYAQATGCHPKCTSR